MDKFKKHKKEYQSLNNSKAAYIPPPTTAAPITAGNAKAPKIPVPKAPTIDGTPTIDETPTADAVAPIAAPIPPNPVYVESYSNSIFGIPRI